MVASDVMGPFPCTKSAHKYVLDNGTEFSYRLIEQMCKSLGISHTTNPVNRVLKSMTKLSDKFSGPYKVVRRLSLVVFRLVNARGKYAGKEHLRHLKPYVASIEQSGTETVTNDLGLSCRGDLNSEI